MSYLGRLIQMTSEAEFIDFRWRQLGRVADVVGRRPFGVRLARTMTCLARLTLPAMLRAGLEQIMRTFGKGVVDIFVADLAGV